MKTAKWQLLFHIFVLIIGFIFLCVGIFYQIPEREIPWNYEEYVGGDAYNIMIEASLRGGEIAGATAAKAIYIVFGSSLLLLSIFFLLKFYKNNMSVQAKTEIKSEAVEGETKLSETIS